MSGSYRLLGAEVSYFTGKARSYLRHKGIPFEEVSATREVYVDEILPRVGWPVIPVVIGPDDETLQDTSDIIDALEDRFPEYPVYPSTPRQRLAALLLEVYGDEWLVLPAMHYRWNHCYEWILREFGRMSRPDLDEAAQVEVGRKVAGPFHGSLPYLGVNEATAPAIERSWKALLVDLDALFAEHPFVFGDRPSIGDFGLIGPLYAHLYRDPYPGELMRRTAPHVARWVERMQQPEPVDLEHGGQFLPDDEVPERVLALLRRMMSEQAPVLLETVRRVGTWFDENAEGGESTELPRLLGMTDFILCPGTPEEVTSKCGVRPFAQWMFQRPLDFYRSLPAEDRRSCDEMLARVNGFEAMQVELAHRVERRQFRLVAQQSE